MNKFVLGALALTAASTPCLAGTGSDEAWLSLDRDINALSANLAPASTGATVNGFIKTSYTNSGDIAVGANNLGGFSIDNARLNIAGTIGDYSVFVALEGSNDGGFGIFGTRGVGGPVGVLDAMVSWNITDQIKGTMGQFRPAFLASALRSDDNLMFLDRTVQGDAWAFRDQGLMVSGTFDQLGWWIGVQNGIDGAGDDLAITGRATFTAMGTAPGANEGALGSTGAQNLTIGVGYYDDSGTVNNRSAMSVDAYFTAGQISASAEIVDYDTGMGNNTPWDLVVGYMIVPDQWEAALRYEDFDVASNTTAITAGVNYYRAGHAAKWQFNYSSITSDVAAAEADVIQVGLVASI